MAPANRSVLFDQDRLDAYNLARSFGRELERVVRIVPRGHADAIDQVRRAALSIALNTAEGAGEFAPKEKARFYRLARRSATEAAAVLDSFVDRRLLTEPAIEPARALLHRVVGALTRLIQSCDPEWTRARAARTSRPEAPAHPEHPEHRVRPVRPVHPASPS